MKHCDGGENTCNSKDLSTNQFDLSTCSIYINITNGENTSEMYNDLVHVAETNQFVIPFSCGTIHEEERQKFWTNKTQ
jgi:hypothetical protein